MGLELAPRGSLPGLFLSSLSGQARRNGSLIPTWSGDGLANSRADKGLHMRYAKVTRNQFEFKDDAIVHKPTGAEFTPVVGTKDSVIIWTGDIGSTLPIGELYCYAEVLAMMKTLRLEWRCAA
jgi:hypothetical protein